MEAELFHADREAEDMTNLIVAFCNISMKPDN
jgi:hypothetical protein